MCCKISESILRKIGTCRIQRNGLSLSAEYAEICIDQNPGEKSIVEESSHPKTPFKERREFARTNFKASPIIYSPLREKEIGVQTRISDISEGGARLVTLPGGMPAGTPVRMSFVSPGDSDQFISAEGVVRHTGILEKDLCRLGVEFLTIKEKDRCVIREHIALKKTRLEEILLRWVKSEAPLPAASARSRNASPGPRVAGRLGTKEERAQWLKELSPSQRQRIEAFIRRQRIIGK